MSKIAIVTGANKGIGREIAIKLCHDGYKTILACRNADEGQKTIVDFQKLGFDAEYRQCDLSDNSSIKAFVRALCADYEYIDALINNAAIAFKNSDPTSFDKQAKPTVQTNFFGTVQLTQLLIPLLRKSLSPRIVNVASQAGHLRILRSQEKINIFSSELLKIDELESLMRQFIQDVEYFRHAENGWPNSCYGMSKLGLIAYTKILAREEPNIMTNACCPGFCATDMSSHRGQRSAEVGARTPFLLATMTGSEMSGKFFLDEKEIEW